MKIIEKIVDIQTGDETFTERDETPDETKARLDFEKAKAEAEKEALAKAEAKSAILFKLGITEDEARLLLG